MTNLAIRQPIPMSDADELKAAVQRTFERCGQAFCRYFTARIGGDAHLVDDLMQRLWLQAHVKAKTLRGADPEPWLWRIARNLLHEHQRKQRSFSVERAVADPALAQVLAERFDTEELPDELLARKEVRDQLLLALTELPCDDQELLIGFYFHGRSQTELAGEFSISVRAVEGRMYRARLALRNKLADLEV